MAKHDEQLHFRVPKELADAVRQKASEEGTSFAAYMRRAMEHEMEGVYQSGTQSGAQSGTQPSAPDYGEQLDRIEYNMDVLRQGMLAMAERQEVTMAAQAATVEAVRVLGEQVGQMMLPVLAEPEEPPALPAPESGEDLLPRSDIKEREIARYFDVGHEHLQRLMAQGDRQAAQRLLGRMRQRYGDERTARELHRRQRR